MSKDGKVVVDIEADDSGFKKTVNEVESEAESAADGLDDLGDSAKDAGDGLSVAEIAAGSFIANALTGLISAIGNAVSSFLELSDTTREYREDMAKLETAFGTAGHSTEAATKSYEDFYAILGESDRSVEAVNHLAELTKNEEELAKWSNIAAGVTAKFGDSLPIEGLTEAANETAKVGAVTGPLADALNWAGISEDEFNKKLAACNTEQERATLITETLNKEYQAAANEYNELTASTQEARRATSEMEQAQAKMGATLEPVMTAWTQFKANAMEALVPVVQKVVGLLQKVQQWAEENPGKMEVIKAVVIALTAALGALAVALGIGKLIDTVKTAFMGLNAVMAANPIGLVVAAIAGLVAAFIYLWNNCEEFREFWINLWNKIKETTKAVVDWFSNAWATALSVLKSTWATVVAFFSGIWTGIKNIFAGVATWFKNKFQAAKDNILSVFSNIKEKFLEIKDRILGAFSTIKDEFFKVGSNIIDGIWEGIKAGWDWLVGKVKSLASALFGAAQEELDSHSPSRKFAWLGETAPQGLGVGWERGMPEVEAQIQKDMEGLVARVQATVGAENSRMGQTMSAGDTGLYDLARAVGTQTAGINSLASQYRQGSGNKQPIVLELNGRELGRAVVNVGSAENTRVGTRLALGGAY